MGDELDSPPGADDATDFAAIRHNAGRVIPAVGLVLGLAFFAFGCFLSGLLWGIGLLGGWAFLYCGAVVWPTYRWLGRSAAAQASDR